MLSELEEQIGIIGKDNLINYIGKNSFEVFKLGACNPNITKISDTEIAVQIDYPVNQETLEFNMQGLCKHLTKCTFKFSEEKYNYTVSIGILKLGIFNKTADQLIHLATSACKHASVVEGNSYYIWKETDKIPEISDTNEASDEPSSKDEIDIKAKEAKEKLEAELKSVIETKAITESKETLNEVNQADESITPSPDPKPADDEIEDASPALNTTENIQTDDQTPGNNDKNINNSENIEALSTSTPQRSPHFFKKMIRKTMNW